MKPGWPLAFMFVGFPVWWLLGVVPLAFLFGCVVMAFQLSQRRHIMTPAGMGWWLLFLLWVFVGVAVLQVDVPGAVSGASNGRYLVWAYRLGWYVGATVVLLYVSNMRSEIPIARVNRIFGCMFVTVVAGGILGTLLPTLDFPSLLELILPKSVSTNGFLQAQMHPTVAQWGDVLGHRSGRPSAPFTYANIWGLNFALLLPYFLASWFGRDAGWRRMVAPLVLVVALIPVIYSLNRGLWFALIVSGFFVAVRSAMTGRMRLLGALLVTTAAITVVLASSPLGSTIEARFSNSGSNEGRMNLGILALKSVSQQSPVVGYGTTRNVAGSFTSIARGDTVNCPRCSPPALGTQGQLSLVTFSQGFVGIVLYVGFFVILLLRYIRLRSPHATMAMTVVVVQLATLPVYNTVGVALFPIMAAVAVLERESSRPSGLSSSFRRSKQRAESATRTPLVVAPKNLLLISCMALVGAVIGVAWQQHQGVPHTATTSIVLPSEPTLPGSRTAPFSLDTQGQLVTSGAVQAAIRAATHEHFDHPLVVTALPNSRVLVISYTGIGAGRTELVVASAAKGILDNRDAELAGRTAASLADLQTQSVALSQSIKTLDSASGTLVAGKKKSEQPALSLLKDRQYRLVVDSTRINADIQFVSALRPAPGHVVRAAESHQVRDAWNVPLVSGLMLGLLAGLVLSLWRDAVSARAKDRPTVVRSTGMPVLAVTTTTSLRTTATPDRDAEIERVLRLHAAQVCVSAESSATACLLAGRLDDLLRQRRPASAVVPQAANRVVVVATHRTRLRALRDLVRRLEAGNAVVIGVVLASGRSMLWTRFRERPMPSL